MDEKLKNLFLYEEFVENTASDEYVLEALKMDKSILKEMNFAIMDQASEFMAHVEHDEGYAPNWLKTEKMDEIIGTFYDIWEYGSEVGGNKNHFAKYPIIKKMDSMWFTQLIFDMACYLVFKSVGREREFNEQQNRDITRR